MQINISPSIEIELDSKVQKYYFSGEEQDIEKISQLVKFNDDIDFQRLVEQVIHEMSGFTEEMELYTYYLNRVVERNAKMIARG